MKTMIDTPKSLGNPKHNAERQARLHEPHMDKLTNFVDKIRRERKCSKIPYFDPEDGGVDAECLFILEAPGPNAVKSGFISRNNPDESAKNWLELNVEVGLHRQRTISWNIVPWYIGDDGRIRAAKSQDIEQGWPYLHRLLGLLPRLRLIVLVGHKAQVVKKRILEARPKLTVMPCPHPSPMFVNRKPGNRTLLMQALKEAASALEHDFTVHCYRNTDVSG